MFYTIKEMTKCFLSLKYCLFLTAEGGDIYTYYFLKIVLYFVIEMHFVCVLYGLLDPINSLIFLLTYSMEQSTS